MKMFDLSSSHRDILEQLVNGDIPEDGGIAILESIEGDIKEKARAYCAVIIELEAESKAKMEVANSIAKSAERLDSKADFLRKMLLSAMEEISSDKLNFTEFSVSIPKPRPSLKIDSVELIPENFKTSETVIKINNPDIKNMLIAGVEIPGARLEYKKTLKIGN